MPLWRMLMRPNSCGIRRPDGSGVGSPAPTSALGEAMLVTGLLLSLGHVLHEPLLGGLGAGYLGRDPAGGEGVDAVAQPQQLRQLGGDDQDRLAGVGERVDDRVDLV